MELKTTGVEIPKVINVLPLEVLEIPQNATAVGKAIFELGWPRRRIVNRLQLRLDYFLDAGCVYKDRFGEIFPIYEDSVERTFRDDPSYKWLSDFARRCNAGELKQTPSIDILERLQIVDAGIRTPSIGLAI